MFCFPSFTYEVILEQHLAKETLMHLYNTLYRVSTEIFGWFFLYPLVRKVEGTKSEMEVQEF